MSLVDEIGALGADIQEGLSRLGGKTAFYEKMLKKLPDSVNANPVMCFIDGGDITQATANAHALKGVFGNLSVTPLYKAYTRIVDELLANHPDTAKELLADILPVQKQFMECIAKYQ